MVNAIDAVPFSQICHGRAEPSSNVPSPSRLPAEAVRAEMEEAEAVATIASAVALAASFLPNFDFSIGLPS